MAKENPKSLPCHDPRPSGAYVDKDIGPKKKFTNAGSCEGTFVKGGGKSYAGTPVGLNPRRARTQSYSPELGPNALKGSVASPLTGNKTKTVGTKIKGYKD